MPHRMALGTSKHKVDNESAAAILSLPRRILHVCLQLGATPTFILIVIDDKKSLLMCLLCRYLFMAPCTKSVLGCNSHYFHNRKVYGEGSKLKVSYNVMTFFFS